MSLRISLSVELLDFGTADLIGPSPGPL